VRARVVVLGIVARSPFAGVAWQALHYVEALRRLGCEAYYVEDTSAWSYDPEQEMLTDDGDYAARYLARLMRWAGLPDRWAYRAGGEGGRVFGLSDLGFAELFARADAVFNVTAATVLREEHLKVPVRVYVETDPVLAQIEIAQGREFTREFLSAHTHHFTFGENLGTPRCPIPAQGFRYRPTRQPVVRTWWPIRGAPASTPIRATTVASWHQTGKDIEWQGQVYTWSKHRQFLRFIDAPRRSRVSLELMLTRIDDATHAMLDAHGWRVGDAVGLSRDILPYRDYITGSDAEFTVAKDQYVLPRSGWFSDRSACYLAAGKPVVTQDTGFGDVLPTGRGLFAFQTMDDVVAALDAIASDPAAHGRAAAEIAAEFFDAERVVGRMLAEVGL
jgi:glycosyltransferase involved in cell wall biosynthesis